MTIANDNTPGPARARAHNARLQAEAAQRRAERRAEGLARLAAHNHALIVDKHKRIYGGWQVPMFG